jgi:hypothetical protein
LDYREILNLPLPISNPPYPALLTRREILAFTLLLCRLKMDELIETPYIKLWKEEGIMYAIYPEGIEVTLEIARHIVEKRLELTNKKSYPCIIDMRGIKSVSKEARTYLAEEGAQYILACGLITGNVFTRTLAHIFLTVNKPKVPTLLFADVAGAAN